MPSALACCLSVCLPADAELCVQLMADKNSQEYMRGRKTLELNADHPVIQALKDKASSSPSEAKVTTYQIQCACAALHHMLLPGPARRPA